MRILFTFLWGILISVLPLMSTANSRGDSMPNVSLDFKGASFSSIFSSIEKQSGYSFYYARSTLDGNRTATISVVNINLESALTKLFLDLNVDWIIRDKSIVLRRKDQARMVVFDTLPFVLKGRVLDEQGNPIKGASVFVKGKDVKSTTNDYGSFRLNGAFTDYLVTIRCVGFEVKEFKLTGDEFQIFRLSRRITELKNVDVYSTGYQEIAKERATGSVYLVDNKLFNRQVGTNVLERISNVTSGLLATSSGETGSGASTGYTIRGIGTLQGEREPLVIVDNFPYEGSISTINPNDVESITVLKDAAASAIWGTRAGNGVIVITTKKGKYSRALKVDFSSTLTGTEKPDLNYLRRADSKTMIDFEKERFARGVYNAFDDIYPQLDIFPALPKAVEIMLETRKSGLDPLTDVETLRKLSYISNNDFRKDLSRDFLLNGLLQQYSVSISGGNQGLAYYASVGYDREKFTNYRNKSDRFTTLFNSSYKFLRIFELIGQISHAKMNIDAPNITWNTLLDETSPYSSLRDSKGENESLSTMSGYRLPYIDSVTFPGMLDWQFRPLEDVEKSNNRTSENDTRLSILLKANITPWLKVEAQYQNQNTISRGNNSYSSNSYKVRDAINSTVTLNTEGQLVYPWPIGGYEELQNSELKSWNARGSLIIDKRWSVHELSLISGIEYREASFESKFSNVFGFNEENYTIQPVNQIDYFPMRPSGGTRIGNLRNPIGQLSRFRSYFLNGLYSFWDRYSISLSGRVDQSNFFGVKTNLQKVPLWSAGLGWKISDEKFFNSDFVHYLKIRTSYGYTGNALKGITSFATFQYATDDYYVPLRPNLVFGSILSPNNPKLTWERVKILNVGVDFSFRDDKLSGSVEYYKKSGVDLFSPVELDITSGFSSYTLNNATLKGSGVDLNLKWKNIEIGKFVWNTRLLFSYNTNKITKIGKEVEPRQAVYGQYLKNYPQSSLFSFRYAGLDPVDGSPRVYLGDTLSKFMNINKKLSIEDIKFHGSRIPKYFGSLINDFTWGNFDLSFNIIYRLGYFFRRSSVEYSNLLNFGWNAHEDLSKRWRTKGDELNTIVPSIPTRSNTLRDQAYLFSDALVERGDHIRLQDIRIGYALKMGSLKRIGLNACNIYVVGSNLGIIWRENKMGLDPNAIGSKSMPDPLRISAGISFSL